MFKLFSQPFPLEDSLSAYLRRAALIGLFIGLFLLLFQPFGISTWETPNKLAKLMGFGVITFVITAFNFTVWPVVFPKQFSDQRWTVGREIGLVMANIMLIAIANRFYIEWLIDGEDSGMNWINMILVTFLIALFPVTGVVSFNYIRQLKKYSRSAAELPVHVPPSANERAAWQQERNSGTVSNALVTLLADNEKDSITLLPANLLFIESSDNYCTVVYLKENTSGHEQPVKPLLRSSLSRLETQIALPHIVRCHRSYVVNLDRVERVTGNAQGYKLHLQGGQFQVPVARKYNETLIAELKTL